MEPRAHHHQHVPDYPRAATVAPLLLLCLIYVLIGWDQLGRAHKPVMGMAMVGLAAVLGGCAWVYRDQPRRAWMAVNATTMIWLALQLTLQ